MRQATVVALSLALTGAVACAHGPSLQQRIAPVAATPDGQGRVAVTVLDLSTGARASVGGDVPLPMMSVFKLPLAVVALDLVDRGQLQLEQSVPLQERDLEGEDFPSWAAWKDGQRSPALETLLSWMLVASDNAAADEVYAVLGGGEAIAARLRALDVHGIQIGETELAIGARLACPGVRAPEGGWTGAAVEACPKLTPEQETASALREIRTSRNEATTDGLVDLLARVDRGELLSKRSRGWLLVRMEDTRTGLRRLKGQLPPGVSVAHKAGTAYVGGVSVAVDDVGIVTAQDGKRFAIAVMMSGSRAPLEAQEDAIARIARAAWDALHP